MNNNVQGMCAIVESNRRSLESLSIRFDALESILARLVRQDQRDRHFTEEFEDEVRDKLGIEIKDVSFVSYKTRF